MLNHVSLMGRLTRDPELRYTTTNKPVATFDLAVPVQSKDRNAPPDYFTIVCWNQTAEFVSRYLTKGRQIVVAGRLSTRKYTGKDGNNYKVVEVVAANVYFADSKGGANENTAPARPAEAEGTQPPAYADVTEDFEEIDDEDLPF